MTTSAHVGWGEIAGAARLATLCDDDKVATMSARPATKMTVDEYLAWAPSQPGRYELYAGIPYSMAAERSGHARMKYAAHKALENAIASAGRGCEMFPDGMTVRIDRYTAHEPDALVYCGPKLPADVIEIPDPVIVVEVLSPSTRHIDASAKLIGYAKVLSIHHYLILNPTGKPAIHHRRSADSEFVSAIVSGGLLRFDPPGIEFDLDTLYDSAASL